MEAITSPFRLRRPLAVIALSPTSLAASAARVVEVAVVKLRPNCGPQNFAARVDPGVPIAPAATEVHGLRDADVRGRPPFRAIAHRLTGLLRGADLAGFDLPNLALPVLSRELAQAGFDLPMAGRSIIDVFALFKRQEPRDLAAAAKFYLGRDHDGPRDPATDAWVTLEVLHAQMARYPEVPADPAGLHRLLAGAGGPR